jgi:hypothetical protein
LIELASNLRRSKRTVGRRIGSLQSAVGRLQKRPAPQRIAPGVVERENLAPNADGKTRVFYQNDPPTNPSDGIDLTAGDLWFDTNDGSKMYRWTGSAWEVAVLSGTNITAGTINASLVNVSNINAGNITTGTLSSITIQSGTPVGGIYPFQVSSAGALKASGADISGILNSTSGTIGSFTLSGTSISTTKTFFSGLDTVSSTLTMGTNAEIFCAYDYDGLFADYYTRIYINKADAEGSIYLEGNVNFDVRSSDIRSWKISSPIFEHKNAGAEGRFTSNGNFTRFGNGDGRSYSFRIDNRENTNNHQVGGVAAYLDASGTLGRNVSSIKIKENVEDIDVSTEKILKIRPVSYYYIDEFAEKSGEAPIKSRKYGLIAEEIKDVGIDEIIIEDSSPGSLPGVRYELLGVLLLKVCKEQQETIEDLRQRLENLEMSK